MEGGRRLVGVALPTSNWTAALVVVGVAINKSIYEDQDPQ